MTFVVLLTKYLQYGKEINGPGKVWEEKEKNETEWFKPLIFPMELRNLNLMEGAAYKYFGAEAGLGELI